MIDLRSVSKSYGPIVALERVNLCVAAGSVTGLLGPNGSGKSTLFRSILGLTPIDEGSIEISGVLQPSGHSGQRRGIVSVADSDEVYADLSPRELSLMTWKFHCAVSRVKKEFPADRFRALSSMLTMDDHAHRSLGRLSHGTRRKAQLLAAILCDPDLLLVDEPTNGLDPDQHVVVQVLLRTLADRGAAILISTHNLAFAESVCDSVALLRTTVIAAGTPEQIREQTGTTSLFDAYAALSMMDRSRLSSAAREVFA